MKKTLINEFVKGRNFEFEKLNEISTIYDEDEGDLVQVVFSDDNSQWEVKMYLNEEEYDFNDIESSEIDESIKIQIYNHLAQLQQDLDSDPESPNYENDLEISNDGLNFL